MADGSRVVVVGMSELAAQEIVRRIQGDQSLLVTADANVDGSVLCALAPPSSLLALQGFLNAQSLLERLPQGVAQVDRFGRIRWHNQKLAHLVELPSLVGQDVFKALGWPDLSRDDESPMELILARGLYSFQVRRSDDRILAVDAVSLANSLINTDDQNGAALFSVRDITDEFLQQQKLDAIHQAGLALRDLSPEILLTMSVEDRVDLLKQQIVEFTQEVLGFETIEIRLIDRKSQELKPLLHLGMTEEAAARKLFAEAENNGVTGYVAATGKSYLCEDTEHDPLYLQGAANACSSLTVPLRIHDEIVGTINVESFQTGWFDDKDQKFLEMFSREIAMALNTLELLVAEKFSTATASTEVLLREVAQPVDEILNDTSLILEKYIGHDPQVSERLQRIMAHTRTIRQIIHKVGEELAPKTVNAPPPAFVQRPKLRRKRILVADEDISVRQAAHELLGRFGCEVETAHNGAEALTMARVSTYDVILADIRLPDMSGYDCFMQLRNISDRVPVILMTGFGYDPAHAIVKARQQGLKSVLYKPFRLDQLLTELEKAVS